MSARIKLLLAPSVMLLFSLSIPAVHAVTSGYAVGEGSRGAFGVAVASGPNDEPRLLLFSFWANADESWSYDIGLFGPTGLSHFSGMLEDAEANRSATHFSISLELPGYGLLTLRLDSSDSLPLPFNRERVAVGSGNREYEAHVLLTQPQVATLTGSLGNRPVSLNQDQEYFGVTLRARLSEAMIGTFYSGDHRAV